MKNSHLPFEHIYTSIILFSDNEDSIDGTLF